MQLLPDWKHIFKSAWSVRLMIFAAFFSGLEVILPMFEFDLPKGVFAASSGVVTFMALLARLLVQNSNFYSDESGHISKKAMGGIGASAAALAMAVTFIGGWEGKENEAYLDRIASPAVWTVCHGETKGVEAGDYYTDAQCSEMLQREIMEYESGLDRCLKVDVPIDMKIALVSWTYNVGVGAACRSTLVRKANAGDLVGACNELPRWNKAGGKSIRGLTNRRMSERKMCLESLDKAG